MDVESVLLIVAAVVGTIAAAAHMLGYVPRAYRRVLSNVQAETASHIGKAVREALDASLDRQRALTLADMERAGKEAEAAYAKQLKAAEEASAAAGRSIQMSGVRQIGIEKQQMKELQGLMVDGILGPVISAIEAWNPDWAERIRTVDPALLMQFIESPWFRANIMPRIQPYLSKFMAQQEGHLSIEGGGWGT